MVIQINIQELMDILEMTPPEQNIMLAGAHGIGKSQILTRYFEAKGLPVTTLFLGQMSDPGDLIGLPFKDDKSGKTDFLPPYWFPTDGKPMVLFLDELNRARPEILQSVMDLTLNRKLAGKSLPQGSYVISAVNIGQEYHLTDLDPALVSRFNIYHFKPSVSEWMLWAEGNNLDKRVTTFIENHSSYLDGKLRDDADNLDKTPDRRGWERVSNIIKDDPQINAALKKAIAGIIGPEVANLFFEALKEDHKVDGKDILMDFHKHKEELAGYTLPELSTVNDSMMRYLELNEPKAKDITRFKFNIQEYIDWLVQQPIREATAHFAETFIHAQYPKACTFLMTHAPGIYQTLADYIMNI